MEIKQLQYFLAVADQLNFSKAAAEVLYVSQPLLSQQIAELERQLRVTLFNRSRRSVQLTPYEGMALAQEARAILDRVNRVETFVQQTAAGIGLQWDLNIGYEEVFERTQLTQALLHFHEEYPSYHGYLTSYTLGQIMKAQHDGEVDLSFTLLPNKKMDPELEVREMGEDTLVLVGASEYLSEISVSSFLKLAEQLAPPAHGQRPPGDELHRGPQREAGHPHPVPLPPEHPDHSDERGGRGRHGHPARLGGADLREPLSVVAEADGIRRGPADAGRLLEPGQHESGHPGVS